MSRAFATLRASPPTAPSAELRFLLGGRRALGMRTRRHAEGVSRSGMLRSGFSWRPGSREGREMKLLRSSPPRGVAQRAIVKGAALQKGPEEGGDRRPEGAEQLRSFHFTHRALFFFFLLPFPKTTFSSGVRKYRPAAYLERGVAKESVLAFRHPLLPAPLVPCVCCGRHSLAGPMT